MSALGTVRSTLADLSARRGPASPGGQPHNLVELAGGRLVEATAFEPDATTHRGAYYYNVVTDQLFKVVDDGRRRYWVTANT